MAITKQDSVFQHISLPGGISTKATEFKELATKGDKWESPVFSIGSAPESADIFKLPPITRKPHRTSAGVVRGGNHPTSGQNTGSGYNPTMSSIGSNSDHQTSGFSNQVDQAFDTKATTNGVQGGGNTSYYDGVTAH